MTTLEVNYTLGNVSGLLRLICLQPNHKKGGMAGFYLAESGLPDSISEGSNLLVFINEKHLQKGSVIEIKGAFEGDVNKLIVESVNTAKWPYELKYITDNSMPS